MAEPSGGTAAETAERWKRHEFLDGLYRFYLERIISFHAFYLPVVGGVVAYVLAHPSKAMALGLMVPVIVSAGAAQIFFSAIGEAKELRDAISHSAGELGILGTHAHMLVRSVRAFFLLHLIIVVSLLVAGGLLATYGELPGLPAASSVDVEGRHG